MFHPIETTNVKTAYLGTKRTLLHDFSELCTQLGADSGTVKKYIERTLGTTSDYAVTYRDTLVIKGRFSTDQISRVLGKV
jgi:translation initiation factor 2 beta subunit (eIF-2beta)/eIF-5